MSLFDRAIIVRWSGLEITSGPLAWGHQIWGPASRKWMLVVHLASKIFHLANKKRLTVLCVTAYLFMRNTVESRKLEVDSDQAICSTFRKLQVSASFGSWSSRDPDTSDPLWLYLQDKDDK